MGHDLKRGFQSLVSSRVLSSVIGLLTLPFVVRVLGATGYGDYAFLMSTFSMMMLVVSPLVTEGVQKFVSEEREREHWREDVVGFYLWLAVGLAVVGSLLVAGATWTGVVDRFLESRFRVFFYFLAVLVVAIQLQVFTRHALLGLGLEPYSETFAVFKKLISRVGGLALAVLGLGVVGFLAADVLSALIVTGAGFLVLRREMSLSKALRSRPRVPVRKLLTFNGLNMITVVLMMSLMHVDVMMVRLFRGGAEAGYYKAALVLAEYILLVPRALESLMLHSSSRLWSQDRRDRIESIASSLTRYVFLSTSLFGIGIFVLSDRFVPLYFGPDFVATVRPLALLLPGVLGFALARPIYGINKGSGRLAPLVLALGVSSLFNVVANYVLIPRYGLTGAAIATSTSYGSMFALQAYVALKLGYSPVSDARPLRLVATVALSFLAIYSFETLFASDYVAIAAVPPVGFLVFSAVAVLTGAIDRSELLEVAGVLPSPIERRVSSLVSRSE